MDKDLKNGTFDQIEKLVADFAARRFLARYLFSFIHARHVRGIDDITPLPKAFRGRLADEGFYISRLALADRLEDPDGTVKFVFELADGPRVESVLISDASSSSLTP